jgi:hypothetical protein
MGVKMSDEQPAGQSDRDSRREAKANIAAEKARAKASRPWYKKKRFMIPLGLLVLGVIGSALSAGSQDTASPPAAERSDDRDSTGREEQDDEPTTTGIGTPARDGKFEFTVNGLECGETRVGDEIFSEEAQGHFCLLNVRVQNIGNERQFLAADAQKLLDKQGTQYSPSTSATFALDPEGNTIFEDINPGNAVEGVIVFDVPQSAQITRAELHDSVFSGGVVVNLP